MRSVAQEGAAKTLDRPLGASNVAAIYSARSKLDSSRRYQVCQSHAASHDKNPILARSEAPSIILFAEATESHRYSSGVCWTWSSSTPAPSCLRDTLRIFRPSLSNCRSRTLAPPHTSIYFFANHSGCIESAGERKWQVRTLLRSAALLSSSPCKGASPRKTSLHVMLAHKTSARLSSLSQPPSQSWR